MSTTAPHRPTRRLLEEPLHPRHAMFDETLARQRRAALSGRVTEYVLVVVVFLLLAALECARAAWNTPPQPLLFVAVALMLGGYAAVRVAFIRRQMRQVKREENARRALRASLEAICGRGWVLFDGVVDHRGHLLGSILAGPGGLFTIIPRFLPHGSDFGERVDHIDSTLVQAGGHPVLADPLGQARRAAAALRQLLAESDLADVPVQPVVVFPGWKMGQQPPAERRDVWVVSEQTLADEVTAAPVSLDAGTMIAVSVLLERCGQAEPAPRPQAAGRPPSPQPAPSLRPPRPART